MNFAPFTYQLMQYNIEGYKIYTKYRCEIVFEQNKRLLCHEKIFMKILVFLSWRGPNKPNQDLLHLIQIIT